MATVRVTDHGAIGDGTTDNLAAIQTAIAALVSGDTLEFDQGGVYGHTKGGNDQAFLLDSLDDIKVVFSGGAKIKNLTEDLDSVLAYTSIHCTNGGYTFIRPHIDGNRHDLATASGGYAQFGGVVGLKIGEGCDDFVVEDFVSTRSAGKALEIVGANANVVSGGRVERPVIDDFRTAGIHFGRRMSDVKVRQPSITSASDSGPCIETDTGLDGDDAPSSVRLYGGVLDGRASSDFALEVTGTTSDRCTSWDIDRMQVLGDVKISQATQFQFHSSVVTGSSVARVAFQLIGNSDMTLFDSDIDNSAAGAITAVQFISSGGRPTDCDIAFCRVTGASAIDLTNTTQIRVHDNTLVGVGGSGIGVRIRPLQSPGSLLMHVEDNDMSDFSIGGSFVADLQNITRRYTAGTMTNVTTETSDTEGSGTVTDF